ncbi:hypothetical protein Ddye_018606 [Dipteronia dyeriana]|uniref:E2 ubiquitin-conjugating enzyme n=1 Tax=Dipteronia dyeriana TaxID=168575 RepID=A0AAD9UBJ0_9ROSI|nr:hypothetical protein Ddye_018606 [Dipteronia dyeriana]
MDQTSIANELHHNEVVLCDVMDFEGGKDSPEYSPEYLIAGEEVGKDIKGKTKICDGETWQNQIEVAPASDPGKSSASESIILNNLNSSNSELSYHHDDDNDDEDCDDYVDDVSDYDDNDNFLYEDDAEDDYLAMQSKFDHVDLPTDVEASVSFPWLSNPALTSASSTSASDLSESKRKATIPDPDLTESKRKATLSDLEESKSKVASSSSSTVPEESCSSGKGEKEGMGDVPKSLCFKQFDIVDDFSDHHYGGFLEDNQPSKEWTRKIQDEWKILEKNLPDTIYVRVCEARIGLLRAVMVGPSGTPYHDGLFVFDCLFPSQYPQKPPMVYYYSGGLRLNPNLYECGKVCLSLLGTWTGNSTEMWDSNNSTMLQVLVSIQALILNAKPFFNEPGYESTYVGEAGEKRSRRYNEEIFILSLKTMMYTLRRPPKHFEELVADHFRKRCIDILITCKAYLNGALVGSVVVKDGKAEIGEVDKCSMGEFKGKVSQMMNFLITLFTKNGSTDCEQYRAAAVTKTRNRLADMMSNIIQKP